ncbi:MAG: hypothetical protein FWB90_08190 [Fibromonadales bacterium]|nr:hypothetical protein [Fibromonadales bacterium]
MVESIKISPSMMPATSAADVSIYKIPTENPGKNTNGYDLSLTDEGWKILDEKSEKKEKEASGKKEAAGEGELSDEEQRKVNELEKIDKKVKVHEQAHVSAAGGYARGGANYNYVTGPDGKRYASGGHVNLDTSPEKTPEATIRKADVIRKAALAPADPSPADRQIAADAAKMAQKAQRELSASSSSYSQRSAVVSGQL